MNTARLSKMCRCGHARRVHEAGNIMAGFKDHCFFNEHPGFGQTYCYYFEAAEGWQDDFADALRIEGYIVERVKRDQRGRFVGKAEAAR